MRSVPRESRVFVMSEKKPLIQVRKLPSFGDSLAKPWHKDPKCDLCAKLLTFLSGLPIIVAILLSVVSIFIFVAVLSQGIGLCS